MSYILEKKLSSCSWAWIIDLYFDTICNDRTFVGDLVNRAKYQSDSSALDKLVATMKHATLQLQRFSVHDLGSITCVTHVPSNPPKFPFCVSSALASGVADCLGVRDISCDLVKKSGVPPAKLGASPPKDAFFAINSLDRETVLVVDDVFRSGSTVDAMADALTSAGAAQVIALCAAKANKGMLPGGN